MKQIYHSGHLPEDLESAQGRRTFLILDLRKIEYELISSPRTPDRECRQVLGHRVGLKYSIERELSFLKKWIRTEKAKLPPPPMAYRDGDTLLRATTHILRGLERQGIPLQPREARLLGLIDKYFAG